MYVLAIRSAIRTTAQKSARSQGARRRFRTACPRRWSLMTVSIQVGRMMSPSAAPSAEARPGATPMRRIVETAGCGLHGLADPEDDAAQRRREDVVAERLATQPCLGVGQRSIHVLAARQRRRQLADAGDERWQHDRDDGDEQADDREHRHEGRQAARQDGCRGGSRAAGPSRR